MIHITHLVSSIYPNPTAQLQLFPEVTFAFIPKQADHLALFEIAQADPALQNHWQAGHPG